MNTAIPQRLAVLLLDFKAVPSQNKKMNDMSRFRESVQYAVATLTIIVASENHPNPR